MESHVVFFTCVLSLLSGIAYASLGLPLAFVIVPAAVAFAILYASGTNVRIAAASALLVLAGFAYYAHDDAAYRAAIAAASGKNAFQGIVDTEPRITDGKESYFVRTASGEFAVYSHDISSVSYGDEVRLAGSIAAPTAAFFSRHVVGVLNDPRVTIGGQGRGNPVTASLIGVRQWVKATYDSTLPQGYSALLFGIIFGDAHYVPKGAADDLEASGLRFLTAIDGLHMQIVILVLIGILESLVPRRTAIVLGVVLSCAFVALTGFTVSGIRAVLMAGIARFAMESRRRNLPHTTLAFAALVLALMNPKTLLFDVGFQLSFLAVIGIVYLMPVLQRIFSEYEGGILDWKESLLITLSVQLATAPLIMLQFQTFSLTSWMASVAIVWMLPYLLIGGLMLAASGFLHVLAAGVAVLVWPLVAYVALVAGVFARIALFFNPPLGFTGVAVYYGVLVGVLLWFYREPMPKAEDKAAARVVVEPTGFEIIEA